MDIDSILLSNGKDAEKKHGNKQQDIMNDDNWPHQQQAAGEPQLFTLDGPVL